MNHRDRQATLIFPHNSKVAAVLGALLSLGAGAASYAQRALPADLKTAADAAPRTAEIAKFITGQIDALKDPKSDTGAQQRARDSLIRESGPAGAVPSASFLQVYASALDAQLLPLAKPEVAARTRLLAAITLQRVAKSANNAGLANSAAAFAQDASPGVALWAMKASQTILPAAAASGKPSKLPAAIVEGVKKHGKSADLTDEAYKALTLDVNTKLINANAVTVLAPSVLELYKHRIGLYVKQTPPRPDLEQRPTNFLTLGVVTDSKWGVDNRAAIMQQIVNLAGVLAQHAAARNEGSRKVFVDEIKRLGDALVAMEARSTKKSPEISNAGKALTALQASSPQNEYGDAATNAFNAIKTAYPQTKTFPKIDDGAAQDIQEMEITDGENGEAGQNGAGGGNAGAAHVKDKSTATTTDRPTDSPTKKASLADKPGKQ